MPDPDLPTAVRRLERAVLRLERIDPAPAPRPAPAPVPTDDAALAALRARHERLRARVVDAIGALDAVIAQADGAA